MVETWFHGEGGPVNGGEIEITENENVGFFCFSYHEIISLVFFTLGGL